MKKIASKILIILIISLLLFDFVFASQTRCVYAAGPGASFVTGVTNLAAGLVALVYTLLKALIVGATYGIQVIVTVAASTYGINTDNKWYENAVETVVDPITPMDIFFNKYKLTDINFFDFEGIEEDSFIYLFRLSIAEWYTIMKLIACAILLVILIYVGVRMALSTIADDKAKYKKMLVDWVVGLLLIFILQYIIIFTIYCNNAIVAAIGSAFGNNEMSSMVSESVVKIGIQGIVNPGLISFASVLVYIFIVFQTIIFLLAYMKRMVKVGFLIMISPLITITYSIDKMGDGKAQALGNWLKEFVYTILIQPFHCIIYISLAQTAIEILQGTTSTISVFDVTILNSPEYNQLAAGVLAILCLKFVSDGEKIVRKIFGFKDDGSTGMAAGAAIGIAAISNAQKIGKGARVGINNMKSGLNRAGKYANAIGKGFKNMGDKGGFVGKAFKAGSSVANGAKKVGTSVADGAKKVGNTLANTAVGSGVVKAAKGTAKAARTVKEKTGGAVNKFKKTSIGKATSNVGKYMKRKANVSTALGIMAAAMQYSAGNSNAIEAVSMGIGTHGAAQQLFGSSTGNIEKDISDKRQKSEEYAHQKHQEQLDAFVTQDEKTGEKTLTDDAKKAIKAHRLIELAEKREKRKKLESKTEFNEDDKKRCEELDEQIATLEAISGKGADEEITEDELKAANETVKNIDPSHIFASYTEPDVENPRHEVLRTSDDSYESVRELSECKFASGREDRYKASMTPPSTKALEETKSKIIARLRAMKQADKYGAPKEGSQLTNRELTVDEEENIESVAQTLIDNIALGVLRNNSFGQEAQKKLIASQLGLNADGRNMLYSGVNGFFDITAESEEQARQTAIAQDYSYVAGFDQTGEGVATHSLLAKELSRYGQRPSREKTSEESEG